MSKGLTLIESLIGMTIISLGVLFVVMAFPLVVRLTYENEINNTALFLATATMENLIAADYDEHEKGSFFKEEITEFENYKIEVNIDCFHPEGDCTEDTGMKEITVEVFTGIKESDSVELTTVITKK